MQIADAFVAIRPDSAGFGADLSGQLRGIGPKLSSIGGDLTKAITLPIAAIGGVALKSAIDFESAFAGVRKTVDASESEFAALEAGIRNMSKQLPASADEIANVAAAAGQLGIETPNILGFTRTMIDLGESTNLSSEEAATSLARLANITKLPQDQFDELGSTVVALGNNLATTESEIVEMGLRIAGAGSQVGLTQAQILAFAGALSSVGIAAEAGGTAISRVFVELQNAVASGGPALDNFAKVAGLSAADFKQAFEKDAAGAIITFIEGLGEMSAAGENVFPVLEELELGDMRVRDALLRAAGAGDLFRESLQIGSKAWEENTALTKEAEQRYKTTASQLKILRNRAVDAARSLGTALLPSLRKIVEASAGLVPAIEKLVQTFTELPEGIQLTVVGFAAFLALLGPALIIIGQMATGIGALASVAGASVAGVSKLAAGLRDIGSTPTYVRVLGLETIDKARAAADGLRSAINGLKSKTVNVAAAGANAAKAAVQGLREQIDGLKDKAVKVTADLKGEDGKISGGNLAKAFGQGFVGAIGGALAGVGVAIAGVVSTPVILGALAVAAVALAVGFAFKFRDKIKKFLGESLPDALKNAFDKAKGAAKDLPDKIAGFLEDLPYKLGVITGRAIGVLVSGFLGLPKLLGETIRDALPGVLDAAAELAEGVAETLLSLPGKLAKLGVVLPAVVIGGLVKLAQEAGPKIGEFVDGVVETLKTLPGRIGEAFVNLPQTITDLFGEIKEAGIQGAADFILGVVTTIAGLPGQLLGLLGQVPGLFVNVFNGALNVVTTVLGNIINAISNLPIVQVFTTILTAAFNFIRGVWDGINRETGNALSNFVSTIGRKLGEAVDWFRGLPGRITGAIGDLGSLLTEKGRQVVQGFIDGIRSLAGRVYDEARSMVSRAVQAAKDAILPGSPSKVFRTFGQQVGQGFALGMRDTYGEVHKASAAMAAIVSSNAQPQLRASSIHLPKGSSLRGGDGGSISATRSPYIGEVNLYPQTVEFGTPQLQQELMVLEALRGPR